MMTSTRPAVVRGIKEQKMMKNKKTEENTIKIRMGRLNTILE